MQLKDILKTIDGKIGQFIQGAWKKHYIEYKTQCNGSVYHFTILTNGKPITVQTDNPIITHCKPFESVSVTGRMQGAKGRQILIASEININQKPINDYYL